MKRNESNENTSKRRPKCFTLEFYKLNFTFCIFILIYVLIQIGLVIQRIIQYKDSNAAVIVARSAGVLLDFNMSFIILLILKRCLTWLGTINILRIILPIGDFLAIHKFVGIFILVLSFIHTIAHCVNQCKIFDQFSFISL
jgi:hypothetical protein